MSIEGKADFNDLCLVPNSGLMFMAVEDPKIQTYFIPHLGPAPRWCAFLDSLTEEMEEGETTTVYDDYKFLTVEELHELGFEHLIGNIPPFDFVSYVHTDVDRSVCSNSRNQLAEGVHARLFC